MAAPQPISIDATFAAAPTEQESDVFSKIKSFFTVEKLPYWGLLVGLGLIVAAVMRKREIDEGEMFDDFFDWKVSLGLGIILALAGGVVLVRDRSE